VYKGLFKGDAKKLMNTLQKKLEVDREQEQKAIRERQVLETEIIAKIFLKKGWNERGKYESEKDASEAAKVLAEHKKNYH